MVSFHAPGEELLYQIWQSGKLNDCLEMPDGQEITVIDHGQHDSQFAGPDFKNVKIRIGSITYVGDIEIDIDYKDWVNHGHNLDKKYDSVILHLTLKNKKELEYVFSPSGRKIPSICLEPLLPEEFLRKFSGNSTNYSGDNNKRLKCAKASKRLDQKLKVDYLASLGVQRFQKKCTNVYNRVKELAFLNEMSLQEPVVGYDLSEAFYKREFRHSDFKSRIIWQQLFYELLFEALGFSKNKKIMVQIAKEANFDFLKKISTEENFTTQLPAVLLYISGLIPDTKNIKDQTTLEYIKSINDIWETLPLRYDGELFQEEHWNFFACRPNNFPPIRITGGAILLGRIIYQRMLENIVRIFQTENDPVKIIELIKTLLIVKAEGYWAGHFNFNVVIKNKLNYLVGSNRADDIIVNVIFPFLTVFFEIYGNSETGRKIFAMYTNYYQTGENNIVEEVQRSLKIGDEWKRSIVSQGMIELFRGYCIRSRCKNCKIGVTVFKN